MGFGVDTAAYLNDSRFNWAHFKTWKGIWPEFAGRYFSGSSSRAGEFSVFKTTTGGVCKYVVPLTPANADRQHSGGTTGYNFGVEDANATITSINAFLATLELKLPSSGVVYVYLDVEAGTDLKATYWAGWANTIFNAKDNSGGEPYSPAVYSQFTDQGGVYLPQPDVQSAVDGACTDYPSDFVQVLAYWTANPEGSSSQCGPDGNADWSALGKPTQDLCGEIVDVPVLLFQYAENCVCISEGFTGFAGKSNSLTMSPCSPAAPNNDLDMDASGTYGAETFMLTIG